MTSNTKSSITLPPREFQVVKSLRARLKLKSNVEVVRTGLRLLQESTEREALKIAFREASAATRKTLLEEMRELDHLASEGLD